MGLLTRSDRLEAGDRAYVRDTIAVATAGSQPGGYRVDTDRLDHREQVEMFELIASVSEGGFAFAKLGKADRGRLEALVEKSVGVAPGAIFDKARGDDRERRETHEREAKRKRRPFSRDETHNFFASVFDALGEQDLWVDDLAALSLVLTMFSRGRTFGTHGSRLEGSGDDAVLTFDRNWGVVAATDGAGVLDGLVDRLVYLHRERWLDVEQRGGPVLRVKLGPRLLAALAGEPFEAPPKPRKVVEYR